MWIKKVNRKLRQMYNYDSKTITKRILKSISFVYEIGEATENLPEKEQNHFIKVVENISLRVGE